MQTSFVLKFKQYIQLFEGLKTDIDVYTLEGFLKFCKEREKIRDKKLNNQKTPWTKDIILKQKKFCNIDRKDDRMTKEFLKIIKNKPDDFKIISCLLFRSASSGTEIPNYLNKFNTLKDLKKDFCSDTCELTQYNKGKLNPYQFVAYKKDYTIRDYIIDHIFGNSKKLIDYVLSCNNTSLRQATDDVCKIINFEKNLLFITFQAIADLSYLFPNNIDEKSEPYYGLGSETCLKEISKKENITKEDILSKIQKSTGFTLLKIEHGLCEYNKYSQFKLGTKSFDSISNDYKINK